MNFYAYHGEVLAEEWDDTTRTYTNHLDGTPPRPYTAEENAEADVRIAEARAQDNEQAINARLETSISRLTQAVEGLAVISNKTNAEITAKDTKDVARASRVIGIEVRRLVRLITRQLNTIESDV